jgi:ubiquinone/menaquinone biosynthesis C-methylase UbiE
VKDHNDRYWQEYWTLRDKYFPESKNCQELYEDMVETYLNRDTIWLDAGCGHKLLHHWDEEKSRRFASLIAKVVGLDGDLPSLRKHQDLSFRVAGNLTHFPFRANSFSLLTSNMVVEHIENPDHFTGEVYRVLKPGGVAIIHTPNIFHWETLLASVTPHKFHELYCQIIEKREVNDVFPTFYRANTLSKLVQLFKEKGMTLEQGGTIVETPRRFPIPFLSKVLLLFSILETKLLSYSVLSSLRPNLLVAFRKGF